MNVADLLTFDKVRAWVAKKPAIDRVGYAGSACRCPLAEYLKEADPEHEYGVGRTSLHGSGSQKRIPVPAWMTRTTYLIDHSRAYGQPVTADQFLSILDEVASEVSA